jgi:RNA polymerase sigma-70 factor (ECF subfamily)
VSDRPDLPERFQPSDPTIVLLEGARAGRDQAVELLLARYGDRLRRWATGRLPGHARHTDDTEDLVQDVLIQSLRRLESFEHREDGAFHSYLRTAVLNRIRNEVRHSGVRGRAQDAIVEHQQRVQRSPLEELIGSEALERYEAALQELNEGDRELVVARMEFDGSYEELAEMTDKPSANACRMALKRALMRLAKIMAESEQGDAGDGATQVLR